MEKPLDFEPELNWRQRLIALLVGGLAAGSLVFWGLQWMAALQMAPDSSAVAPVAGTSTVPLPTLGPALGVSDGAGPAAATAPSRPLNLTAVMAAGAQGRVLIAVDSQKAQPYGLGDEVVSGRVVVDIQPRSVGLGANARGPVLERLELPAAVLPARQ